VPARGRVDALTVPATNGGSPLHFLDLRLVTSTGEPVSSNFYWLPTEPDVLDWDKAFWVHTPVSKYANLRALRSLPRAQITVKASRVVDEDEALVVEVKNPTDRLAFFVQARLADEHGDDLLPVLWSDNYVSLLPGERAVLRAQVPGRATLPHGARVEISGINVARTTITPEPLSTRGASAGAAADRTEDRVWTGAGKG